MSFYLVPLEALSISELYEVLQLRQQVFILEQTCLYADIDGKDSMAYHALLKVEDQLVAYARFFPKGKFHREHASIGRVLVHPAFRKRKLGHDLLRKLLEEVERRFGRESIKIAAQTHLMKYYEQYGFEKISAEYLEDDIPHVDMLRF